MKKLVVCWVILVAMVAAFSKDAKPKKDAYKEIGGYFFAHTAKNGKYYVIKNTCFCGEITHTYSFSEGVELSEESPFIAECPDFFDRLEGDIPYTLYVKAKKCKDEDGDTYFVGVLFDIDGLRDKETAMAAKAEKARAIAEAQERTRLMREQEEQAKIAKEKAEKEAQERAAQEAARLEKEEDARIRAALKGYVYHGKEEGGKNQDLFDAGAFETGHAYYLPNFHIEGTSRAYVSYDWNWGSPIPKYRSVEYASQKIKGEIATNNGTAVIIAGGTSPFYIPVVLFPVK